MKVRILVLFLGLCTALILLETILRTIGYFHETMRPVSAERRPGAKVILCAGDSITYGYGLPREQAYPSQLEKALNAAGRNFQVINLGRSGEPSWTLAENIDEYLAELKPDLLTVMIGGADRHFYSLPNEQKSSMLLRLLSYSRTINLLHMLFADATEKLPEFAVVSSMAWDRLTGFHKCLPANPSEVLKARISRPAVCSIDFPRFSGEVWDLARNKDTDAISVLISRKSKPLTEEIMALGMTYLLKADYQRALAVFNNAAAVRGNCYLFSVGIGLCDLLQYRAAKASAYFLDALEQEPNDTGAMLCLGCSMLFLGRRESARLWFEKVLEIDPANGWACNFLGRCCLDGQDLENALKFYQEGIRLEPELTMNYTSLGELYSHQKDFIKARQVLEDVLKRGIVLDWEKSHALLVLAVSESCLDPGNSTEKARGYLMEAVRCDQRNYGALNFLLTSFGGQQEDLQSAIDSLEKSGHPNAAYFLRQGLEHDFLLHEPVRRQLQLDLSRIIETCREKGVKLVFLNYPNDENPVMKELSREQNIPFIDILDAFNKVWAVGGKRWDYFLPDFHCSELGNRKIAETIAEKIPELLPEN
ncbi:MAG: GDSL-type esterase/lipase family protein [Candidatus Wallbacteria bacterium]|nr:GDSL-type esterase/lipase family protein [Candidatus Wallbacteria bacterium]